MTRLAAFGALLIGLSCGRVCAADSAQPAEARQRLIDEGRYLVIAGDCIACHTRAHGAPFAGGRPLHTPFGVVYSANITTDPMTGIGAWSESQFGRAMREGLAADGTHLYPAFPYTAYTKLTDHDVHAIYAYLRSLQPVHYAPPRNGMPFPFSVRALVGGWNLLFFRAGRYAANPARSAEWNRGAYLTQALGHCGACHSPHNYFGGERTAEALTGGEFLDEIADEVVDDKITPLDESTVRTWSAANLTPSPSGLGAWSLDAIAAYLKSGHS